MTRLRFLSPGRLFRKFLAVIVVTALSLFVLEWSVRWLMPAYDPAGRISFTLENGFPLGPPGFEGRLWRNTGDYDVSVSINALGLRDWKDLRRSAAGDVFVVGDSFSFGWGVEEEDRYSNLLDEQLGLPVYNIAIPSDFEGYARLIGHARENGAVIERLLVGVCMENDLQPYPDKPIDPSKTPGPGRQFSVTRLKSYLNGHSAFYGAMTTMVHRHSALEKMMTALGWTTKSVDGMVRNSFDPAIIGNSADRLVRLIAESGAEHSLVLLIPSRGLWQGGNEEVELRVHREFVAALAERGLQMVDMKDSFEKGGDPLVFHFPSDGHWNEAGHALAAEAIGSYSRHSNCFDLDRFRP